MTSRRIIWTSVALAVAVTLSMHIIERMTRKGNEILYQMTIEDPDVLIEPWVVADRTLRLQAGAPRIIPERDNCEVYEEGNITTQLRH